MTLQEYISSIHDKKIAVIGMGVSNLPLIRLLLASGCKVTVCDKRNLATIGADAFSLLGAGAVLRLGDDYLENLDFDVIFRTPGLMPFDEHLEYARKKGAVVTSEMEVFFQVCPCRIIAITGSDGKTTTSTITSLLLKKEGYTVHLGGNIGNPLLCETPYFKPEDFAVLELSSFQLHSMMCKPERALITNISPNHLDKHKDYQDYIDAKKSIFLHQDLECRLVLNLDDPLYASLSELAPSKVSAFSLKQQPEYGVYRKGNTVYRKNADGEHAILDVDQIRIPGEHNVANYMAAFALTDGIVSDQTCREVAEEFAGVEHRLELVAEINGIRFINDSIASSPTRTIAGLKAMKTKPTLILGGYDKHIPFDGLGDELNRLAKRVYLCGATADKIEESIKKSSLYSGTLECCKMTDFKETVYKAFRDADQGDIIVLSPACAAFDQFKNFAERGKVFKSIVMEIAENEKRNS